ncbi:hypothetical protein BKA65DRAFT_581538 [Rhexocercosporidium sp. MPI-PUGE-AT-0058]|nr:hypothetical protein BKA65DRAFT_581538 [Rhexocercosporidium sp. MPI-PUGE-AT-0058]
MSSASSLEPLEPPTTLSTNDLTYGIEIECVFAFHEDLTVFPNDTEYRIQKTFLYSTRQQRRFSRVNPFFSPNRTYNSWGIKSNEPDKVTKERLNPWKKEPLQIVANILRQNIPAFAALNASRDLYVLDTLNNAEKKNMLWDNRKQWKITKDHSVCSVGSQNIEHWLPGKRIQAQKWDSFGVELISPILNSNTPNDKVRIMEIVDALKKDATKTAFFITNECGLHVHVQGPNAAQFQRDLNMLEDDAKYRKAKVWRELAMILLVYEDEIARLHPPCRRPGHPNAEYQFQNNRLGFMKEDLANIFPNNLVGSTVPTSIEDCIKIDCSTRAISRKATIPQIRDGVSKYSDSDVVALVNWPRTIRAGGTQKPDRDLGDKDRQARGSLDGEDVNRWVEFCIGIVRLAHLYAADPERFRVRNWRDVMMFDETSERNRIDVFDLMRDMEWGDDAVSYWERRVATYMCFVKGGEHDRLDDEVPPNGFVRTRGGSGGSPSKRPRDDTKGEEDGEKQEPKVS